MLDYILFFQGDTQLLLMKRNATRRFAELLTLDKRCKFPPTILTLLEKRFRLIGIPFANTVSVANLTTTRGTVKFPV